MSYRRISQRPQPKSQKIATVKQKSYFREVLEKVNVCLKFDDSPNVYLKEQSIVLRDLRKELENSDSNNNIEEFINGLKELIEDEKLFKRALLSSEFRQENDNEVMCSTQQDSVFRLLLNMDCLQNEVINVILEELTTHALEDEEDTIWVRLLLGAMRYLPYLKEPDKLSNKLLEILEVATYSSQLEILTFIPDIIPDSEYDDTARHLSKILNENTKLTGAIIDCLNYLNLSTETKSEIQDRILNILKSTTSTKIFPTIFCFLITDCKPDNLQNILQKTRTALDGLLMSKTVSKDGATSQVMTFDEIREIAISSKVVSEGWLSLISSIRSANDYKSVDIIILFMLHSVGGNKKHIIETLIKKKIKNRHFKTSLFETTLKKCLAPQLLNDYIKSIIEISTCLLRTQFENLYVDFAQIMFVTTFSHQHAEKQHRQQILNSLILLTGSGEGKRGFNALIILKTLAEKHLQLIKPHTMQLMGLLDKLEEIDLKEVQQMFDVLCLLTCGPDADDAQNMFQNDIHMLVRKQLSSSKKIVKYRGIIAAVTTAKHIAKIVEDDTSLNGDESYNSISSLPPGPAKQAATLLELANTSTQTCPIAQGLYYDQLAQMITVSGNLNKHFMAWLFDVITNDFQRIYVSDITPASINDIDLEITYNLNTETETGDSPIAVNIAELTIKSKENNNVMLIFAPLFRLLRLIHFTQYAGKLESIDALLGCGVILPELDPDLGVDKFDSEQARQVIDSLYHTVNWFREVVSAFVNQEDEGIQGKVLKRLKNLVEVEGVFTNYMKLSPDHKLPLSDFYTNLDTSFTSVTERSAKTGESSKRKRPAANLNATKTTQTQTQAKPTRKPSSGKEANEKLYQFREMDTDVLTLLRYNLSIEQQSTDCLNLPDLRFLLKDLVLKLTALTKTGTSCFTHLTIVKSDDFVRDCVKLMPHINRHLIKIIDETKRFIDRNDGISDAHEMFLQTATDLKMSFTLILEMLALLMNWSGFQDSKHLPLLRECLRALVDEGQSQLNSAQRLILEFCKCLMKMTDICLTLPCAVHLVSVMKALGSLSTDEKPQKDLIVLAGNLLRVKWYNITGLPETGAVSNVNIDILVKAHLAGSTVVTISNIVSWVQHESSALLTKDTSLTTFPSITKQNFPIIFRSLCAYLVEALNTELTSLTNREHLTLWFNVTTTMKNLMNIVKNQDSRPNLSAFLKRMMSILKIFMSHGLPILEIMLKTQADKIIEILKTLQQTTRFIHNLCCHTKLSKDKSLIAYVPQMRLTLETLVYRVKATLTANDCSAAFWMGNLRNKNLKGEEILSQASTNSLENSEMIDSADELPPEDDSDNDAQSVTTEVEQSASEIY